MKNGGSDRGSILVKILAVPGGTLRVVLFDAISKGTSPELSAVTITVHTFRDGSMGISLVKYRYCSEFSKNSNTNLITYYLLC